LELILWKKRKTKWGRCE